MRATNVHETPAAWFKMPEIAKAERRIVALTLGGEDFALTMGMLPTVEALLMPKQQLAPRGTAAAVDMQIQPDQPTGTGFGAGVKSSLTSVEENPGQRPAIDHGIGVGQLLGRKWMYDGGPPMQVRRSE